MSEIEILAKTKAEIDRLRAYYPHRIHWVAELNGEWFAGCSRDRRQPNRMARSGWNVYFLTTEKQK